MSDSNQSKLDEILTDALTTYPAGDKIFFSLDPTKQRIKQLLIELADELTDDMSGLGRDIINTDELKQRINEL